MPVAIAPINRQVDPRAIEFRTQCGDEVSHLSVDRADSAKVVVMLGNFEHPFAWDGLAAQYVLQERDYIVTLFGAAKGDDQDGVIVIRHGWGLAEEK